MIHRVTLGKVPPKPHTQLWENDKLLMEQMITRGGFNGPFSILYYRRPPTGDSGAEPIEIPGYSPVALVNEQALRRRHLESARIQPSGDWLSGRVTLVTSDALEVGVCKPIEAGRRFFSNGDGDEAIFVTEGAGRLESLYGVLPFRRHDYVVIPKSTPYRMVFDDGPATMLWMEGAEIGVPGEWRNRWGQLSDFAPYSHRDFRVPGRLLEPSEDDDTVEMVVKRRGLLTLHRYDHFPFDVAGWDGVVYPIAFNIHDYQPKTGLVHLPPTIHVTFGGPKFVICSFVPRKVDYHPKAIPCPYAHANVDMDEILYYVEGDFTSRRGIQPESISLHPAGITHGPHPGTYETSIGTERTEELAVMIDCYPPFRLTTAAVSVEDHAYHDSWGETSDG
jgi:homogentisate 1,2-dioxygenase